MVVNSGLIQKRSEQCAIFLGVDITRPDQLGAISRSADSNERSRFNFRFSIHSISLASRSKKRHFKFFETNFDDLHGVRRQDMCV